MDKKQIAKHFLGLDISEDNFKVGELKISDYEDIVIEIADRYYNYCERIYKETEKEFEESEVYKNSSFKYEVLKQIKQKFFPRYREFEGLFDKTDNFKNPYFEFLPFWTNDSYDRDLMIRGVKLSKRNYVNFINNVAPIKLKKSISQTIPITLSLQDLAVHSFLVGRSGSGKSVLVLELAKNILDKRQGSLVLIEPHGDLAEELARLTKPKDLVYIDPFLDNNFIPTINIFDIEEVSIKNISIYTSVIVDVFKQIVGSEFSSGMQSLITPMVAVLLQIKNSSFFDMLRFLDDNNNQELLEYAQNHALNPAHREYFKTQFLEKRASVTKFSIVSRLQVLLQDSYFANMLTGKTTINLEKLINTKGKVIIIRLNSIKMKETIEPIGKFITALITAFAFKRESLPMNQRVMTNFFLDEAPVFLGESINIILEQARKFKLSLHLVAQNNYQLGTQINASVLSNTSIKFVTINSHKNHTILGSEIGVPVEKLDELTKKGEFYIKVGQNKAFKFQVSPRLLNKDEFMSYEDFEEVKQEQLKKYYRETEFKDIEYAKIPKPKAVEHKHYSKQSTNELLNDLSNVDNEVELLEY